MSHKQPLEMRIIIIKYLLVLFLVGMNADASASQSIVHTLPGYHGPLPFKLETGYIGVGENTDVQLFYYFIQSENDPATDPLILWIPGGPGCSSLHTLFYEMGPLAFDIANFDGTSLPSLTLNPYSWTKFASIIFLDTPRGTGFSYSNTSQGYASSDSQAVLDNYTFLRKWFSIHPTFLKNRLYIAGESYGGKMVLLLALEIAKGNEAGLLPKMSLKGYIIGNAGSPLEDHTVRITYAHRMGLISDQQLQLAMHSCNGDYKDQNPNNSQCLHAIELIEKCTDPINAKHILEPKCLSTSPKLGDSGLPQDDSYNLLTLSNSEKFTCRDETYVTSYIWANDEYVRESLHIKKETITEWNRCNEFIVYENDIQDVLESHQLLVKKDFPALIYSGDHDMVVPYIGTLKSIHQLNVTVDELWRPWTVDGQVAGYTERYKHNEGQTHIVFATVKGAGHTAPEYKPKECFALIQKWFSLNPL